MQSSYYACIVLSQFCNIWMCKTRTTSIFSQGFSVTYLTIESLYLSRCEHRIKSSSFRDFLSWSELVHIPSYPFLWSLMAVFPFHFGGLMDLFGMEEMDCQKLPSILHCKIYKLVNYLSDIYDLHCNLI